MFELEIPVAWLCRADSRLMPPKPVAAPINAAEVRDALRRRHPAVSRPGHGKPILGAWTVITEWEEIDLLAISSYRHPEGAQRKGDYPWVGYEVKVSRGDLRRELLEPGKRRRARLSCHEFYFAVPAGLLKPEELQFEEPDWDMRDFARQPCPGGCRSAKYLFRRPSRLGIKPGAHMVPDYASELGWTTCPECGGAGHAGKSRVELEAPTLWVPRDVGLVEVHPSGRALVRKKSPLLIPPPLTPQQVGNLVRWVSVRPDQRHHGIAEEQRAFDKEDRRR